MTIQGIDIYEGNLDDPAAPSWTTILQGGFSFVLHRANESARQDRAFAARWPQLATAGLLRGAYYLPRPDTVANYNALDSGLQVFVQTVGRLVPGDFGPMLDLEDRKLMDDSNPVSNAAFWVDASKHLLEQLETSLGRQPVIYTQRSWWVGYTNDARGFGQYPLWVVDVNHATAPVLPTDWATWAWWQWHFEESTSAMPPPFRPGVDKGVDLNRFNGTLYELRGLADMGRPSVATAVAGLPGIQSTTYIAQTEIDGHLHLMVGPTLADNDLFSQLQSDPVLLLSGDSVYLYFRSGDHIVEASSSASATGQWQTSNVEDAAPVHDPRAVATGTRRYLVYWSVDDDWYLLGADDSWTNYGALLQEAGIKTTAGGGSSGQPNLYVNQDTLHVIGRVGQGGHLYDVWNDGTNWRGDDLTQLGRDLAPQMPAATYCPCAYETSGGAGVVFRGVGGDLWVIRRADNAPTNLSSTTSATTAIGSPTCLVFDDAPHIVYRGIDGGIYDIFLSGAAWAVQQVCTRKAASDPAADAMGASAIAWRTPDGGIQLATLQSTGWSCQ